MRLSCFTKPMRLIAGLLAGLIFAILIVPLNAQTVGDSSPVYDISKEITLTGTVSSVMRSPAPGMVWGSHLILETLSGKVDASLGRWGLEGKDAISVIPGQQGEVTGVMKTLNKREVFLARTVKVNDKVYTLRTRTGVAVSPQSREIAARKGETL